MKTSTVSTVGKVTIYDGDVLTEVQFRFKKGTGTREAILNRRLVFEATKSN